MFTAALPVRAKAQKHLRVLPWLNKPWSILEAVYCNYIMLLKCPIIMMEKKPRAGEGQHEGVLCGDGRVSCPEHGFRVYTLRDPCTRHPGRNV